MPARTASQAALKEHELPVQMRVHKSLKLWSLYADMEESLGTFESAKAVYTRMLELRVATPQLVINFAAFLEERNYFEDSFAVSTSSSLSLLPSSFALSIPLSLFLSSLLSLVCPLYYFHCYSENYSCG